MRIRERYVNTFGLIVLVVGALASVVCAGIAIAVRRPPRSRTYVAQATVLGILVALAPIAVVLFIRLSIRTCVVLNVLGLPWAEPWRGIAHGASGAMWLAATVLLIIALVRPRLRRAGIAMLIWSGVSVIPAFFLLFLIVYGDPAAGCVAV
jgi:hypothetical protein